MRFLVLLLIAGLFAAGDMGVSSNSALAIQQTPHEAKPCVCGVHCGCTGVCYCPRLVTFLDGSKAVFVPAPPSWPKPGSFPFVVGKAARWTVGAPQRVPVNYRVIR